MDSTAYSAKYSIMYDYNFLAGFIAVAPAPAELSAVTLATSESFFKCLGDSLLAGTNAPDSSNRKLSEIYNVYITLKTSGDYQSGGIF